MPKISLSTWSLFLKMNYRRAIQFAVENGFEGVELWSNSFDFWPRTLTVREIDCIKSMATENRLDLAVHFCTAGNNLAALNAGHLSESMNQLKETIRLCRRIGAGIVVVHPGTSPAVTFHTEHNLNPKYTPTALLQAAIERYKKSLIEGAAYAESHDVVLAVESFGHEENSIQATLEDLADWVDSINMPSLRVALDTGHAFQTGGLERAIAVLGRRICHVHVSDADNSSGSCELELGTGEIDWPSIAEFLKSFEGMLSLEVLVRDNLEAAILRSKSFLAKLLAA
ncbi:MAG: sugar phosphate isomerase/epimerase family protein [Syntrophobacteraceae bacterium]|nr:sugar phosphate isomerase/epimerase [Desulfobacteraceae bacterium]